MSDREESQLYWQRHQQILDGAAVVMIRLGYDKTTISDIAEAAGTSRRTVYQYFNGKEELFEALLYREYLQYMQTWLERIETDPRGGTIGGCYRAIFHAVNRHPLIAALLRRDRRVIGNYLRKRDNIFTQMLAGVNTTAFFQALQAVGAIRQDINASVIEHIIEMLSYGQLTIGDFKPPDQFPPYDAVMEALADLMDRALAPGNEMTLQAGRSGDAGTGTPGTGDSKAALQNEVAPQNEAGKEIIRQITAAARAQLEQLKQAKNINLSSRDGATHDNR